MAKERNVGMYFKVSPKERDLIWKRSEEVGIHNLSAYLREMAIDGYIIRLDIPTLKELMRLIHITANNVNQIAHRANEMSSIYAEDIQNLQTGYTKVWNGVRKVLQELSKLK